MSARRAVFLDRDGVLNQVQLRAGRPHPPDTPEQLQILPGVVDACRRLRQADFLLIVVTNQPDINRGATTRETVDAINERLRSQVPVDAVRVCPHDDVDRCNCRKPRPGLLTQAADEFGIDLPSSFMVGDRWRDVEAGKAAGCRTVWIRNDYPEASGQSADHIAKSLIEACDFILSPRYAGSERDQ